MRACLSLELSVGRSIAQSPFAVTALILAVVKAPAAALAKTRTRRLSATWSIRFRLVTSAEG